MSDEAGIGPLAPRCPIHGNIATSCPACERDWLLANQGAAMAVIRAAREWRQLVNAYNKWGGTTRWNSCVIARDVVDAAVTSLGEPPSQEEAADRGKGGAK